MGLVNVLSPLYEVVAWVLQQIHDGLSHLFGPASGLTWALTIVLLVVLVRIILFPLFVKQIHAQRKMADLAPKVQELRKKYKGDKQRMNQEVMKLYQENGANPISGCLPLVLQFPVFISLFQVLRAIADDKALYGLKPAVVASAQHAHIFGVTVATTFRDAVFHPNVLAASGVSRTVAIIVVGITVLISGTTTYLTVQQSMRRSMTTSASDNPMMQSQKMMGYAAPLFALSGLYWQYGLVLYWVCTNLWTMGQQRYIFKKYPQTTPAAEAGGQAAAGSARGARTGGPAKGGPPAKAGPPAKGGVPAKGGQAAKAGAPAKGSTATKGSTPAKGGSAAGGSPARTASSSGRAAAGARSLTGSSSSRTDGGQAAGGRATTNGQGGLGLGRLLRRGQESREAEQPPEPAEQPRIVRRQPVRQSRSKRTGKG